MAGRGEIVIATVRAKRLARLGLLLAPGLAIVPFVSSLAGSGCTNEVSQGPDGGCVVDPDPCSAAVAALDAGSMEMLGLKGYSCTGSARPDDSPKYVEGVPEGIVCADEGADGGARGFCCSAETTPCAYYSLAPCDAPTYGYQCRGADRPESLNPTVKCGQGVYEGDLINYCCAERPTTVSPPPCTQKNDACPLDAGAGLIGWTCPGERLPKAEDLDQSSSRADLYYFLCATPAPASQAGYFNYCCYPPALVPPGGSCVQDISVPGCAPARFGFACYGPDTPEDDYVPMHCPDPGIPGRSHEGYPATLYCCDFQ